MSMKKCTSQNQRISRERHTVPNTRIPRPQSANKLMNSLAVAPAEISAGM